MFTPAIVQRYHVRFNGFADIAIESIGEIEAIAAARHLLMVNRGVRKAETLQSGRITFIEDLQ